MKTTVFDGKSFSGAIDRETAAIVQRFISIKGKKPKLLIVDPTQSEETKIYGRSKIRKADKLGIEAFPLFLNPTGQNENPMEILENIITEVNPDGIIVERPYPFWLDSLYLEQIIPEYLDIEGISIKSQGKNMIGYPYLIPATAEAVMLIMLSLGDDHHRNVCIINRSTIVGRPLAMALLSKDYTVTVCHSKTRNLKEITRSSDIIVSAIGKANYFDASFISEGAVLIDVGTTESNGKIVGDFDMESVSGKASFITPVPGGVGPVTTSVLFSNMMKAAMDRIEERLNF